MVKGLGTSTPQGVWQTTTTYDDTSAVPGQTYYYWAAAAMDANGLRVSGALPPDTGWVAISAPTGVAATDGTYTDRVRITWNASAGATHYRVWRNTTSDLGTSSPQGTWQTTTTYDDMSASPGQTYYYWAAAAMDSNGSRISAGGGPDAGWRAGCAADFDIDGDVDLTDFLHFQACFNGANQPPAKSGCEDADLDDDSDADLNDFRIFQNCFNGSNQSPACGG